MPIHKHPAKLLILIVAGLWAILIPAAQAQRVVTSGPLLTLDLSRYDTLHRRYTTFPILVELLKDGTLVTSESGLDGHSRINFWNLKTGKLLWNVPLPASIENVLISPDARYLFAHENEVITATSYYAPRRLFVWDIDKKKLVRTIDIGQKAHVYAPVFLPGRSDKLIQIAREGDVNRLLYVNLDRGKVETRINYPNGTLLEQGDIVFSPDGRHMACVYPYSDGPTGSIDFWDVRTAKLQQTCYGSRDRLVDHPCFFQSSTRFVFCDFVYDLGSKKITPLFQPHHGTVECVSGVPSRPDYALYLSKQGLELWNIPRRKFVRRWTQIKQADTIYWLKNDTLFGIYNKSHEMHPKAIVRLWKLGM